MTVVCDHGDGLLVIAGQDSENSSSTVRFECNAITDTELQHGLVGVNLTHEPETLHDAMIQVYEFSFGQMIYVDATHSHSPGGQEFLPAPTIPLGSFDGESCIIGLKTEMVETVGNFLERESSDTRPPSSHSLLNSTLHNGGALEYNAVAELAPLNNMSPAESRPD